jgi:hypothetical protein
MVLLELLLAVAFLLGALLSLVYGFYWIRAQFSSVEQRGRVPCPHCAELIQPAANICRFCQREVGDQLATPKSPRGLFQ